MTPEETDRLARMTAALRPGWPLTSLRTRLASFAHAHPHRSYADTAHALVAIALDPATNNPGRLAENGPWWQAAPGHEPERPVTRGTDCRFCDKCRAVIAPGETDHDCRVRFRNASSTEARAAARKAAADARGGYERATAGRRAT